MYNQKWGIVMLGEADLEWIYGSRNEDRKVKLRYKKVNLKV